MLRLNRVLVSRNLKQMSNIMTKSGYYYSSEPPDQSLPSGAISAPQRRPHSSPVFTSDSFLRRTTPEMNLFGPHDTRAPLNGNIGVGLDNTSHIHHQLLQQIAQHINAFNSKPSLLEIRDIDIDLFLSNSYKSRCHKFFRVLKYQKLWPKDMDSVGALSEVVDCNAHQLSPQMIKKFALLFPRSIRQALSEGLTAITLSRKTVNDMSGYSEAVELEREDFFEKFVSNAKTVCEELQSSGYWADFIDPYSGQPFLSDHTNETLFETDDRFVHLGFRIEDLGCCKAIYHPKWATHVIVGTIFTTAPHNSPALSKLITDSVDSINK
ncbi:unnamed protein product [Oppiella nova]|uniref:Methylmalonic aciduria and homocystinuria type D protein, mitochondrial n=1 Tax=Oppiella nova TaxID=334625 RepID=A0A7R9L917_9ACAR|nr:unnamed protein product [Oppiella nova]CAG2160267.1 unnamed protein product [Oppiella nova]